MSIIEGFCCIGMVDSMSLSEEAAKALKREKIPFIDDLNLLGQLRYTFIIMNSR
tara:strand:+ start:856 stop:1017 length:162 start_codon:yes stop_codon:yes gene_type:complete